MVRSLFDYGWKILASAFAFAAGLVGSRLAIAGVGITLERAPGQAAEDIAVYYLLVGSLILTLGLVPAVRGLGDRLFQRWAALALLLLLAFAVSTSIEASIYSTNLDARPMIAVLTLPCVLMALVLPALLGADRDTPVREPTRPERPWAEWAARGLAATVAFPLVYFLFGILASPIVGPFYERGVAGLVLPSPGTILATQVARGVIHLAAVLPVVLLWRSSKRRLTLALGSAFFVFVVAYDPILAYEVPATLVIVHGIEVALGSFTYAWLLVTLLVASGRA